MNVVLLAMMLSAHAASSAPLQEQEIHLKLRILVPRTSGPTAAAPAPQVRPIYVPQAVVGLPLSIPRTRTPTTTLLSSYLAPPRIVKYRQRPIKTIYAPLVTRLKYAAPAPVWPRPVTHTTTSGGKYDLRYNYSGPALPLNITMGLDQHSDQKNCNCNGTQQDDVKIDPQQNVEEEDDDTPTTTTTSNPVKHLWAGYIPNDLLRHAKRNNTSGNVDLEKNVDKLRIRQKWKHSNYPKTSQLTATNPWKALQEDLKDLSLEDGEDHHDPHLDSPQNLEEEDHEEDDNEDTNQYFVDFWGNRIPKYENAFKSPSQTITDSEDEYNNDPHGWNPEYTNGLWTSEDNHLKVFSGHQHLPQNVKHPYANGMGEDHNENYNRYVADNGTWIGPKHHIPVENLNHLLKDSVSHENGVRNPHETYKTYKDVIRYLNNINRQRAPQSTTTAAPPPPPSLDESKIVDLLMKAVKLHKAEEAKLKSDDDDDDEQEVEVSSRVSNGHGGPDIDEPTVTPKTVCKGVRNSGVAEDKDTKQMEHSQGVVCVDSYDYSANQGQVDVEEDATESSAKTT